MAGTVYEHLSREHTRMVQFLDRNQSVSGFLEALIAHLTMYCEKEGLKPEEVELDLPFVTMDGTIQARIRRR
jgi:hypothetical protein